MCNAMKSAFGDTNDYKQKGGLKQMSDALGRGVVLVMSLWDDKTDRMLWLDSFTGDDASKPGASRGPCPNTSGYPDQVESQYPQAYVKYGNIKVGEVGSTNPDAATVFL